VRLKEVAYSTPLHEEIGDLSLSGRAAWFRRVNVALVKPGRPPQVDLVDFFRLHHPAVRIIAGIVFKGLGRTTDTTCPPARRRP
jgi:hypothetical protein